MTIEISYKSLANENFLSGMRKIAQNDKWKEPKSAYNASRLLSLVQIELKTFNELRGKFIKKISDSAPVPGEERMDDAVAKAKELREEAEKFGDIAFEINRQKIDFTDLEHVPMTPAEIIALEPILDNLPE